MYEYFLGQITDVTPSFVVIEVAGIGYKVLTANPYRYQVANEPVKMYIHQAVSENGMSLFGFYDADEKALFEKLLNVSGIGPKSALAILANNDHSGLIQAINQENATYLTSFPGVGKKTAQQIVLDLKGKLNDLNVDVTGQTELDVTTPAVDSALADALAALKALGYSAREVKKITKKLETYSQNHAVDTNDLLSEGLRLLTK
ncbi:Holliday junction branch migration protein RuvA [Lactiplantibacillus fabifermentans]|uniref:Holliday junction branch migration complex subunit RuvA n=2 Tax=Lactiplantibacillus fabifermentans TaxID=483011 RepID=A0A0R2NR60_9LACO|nr:Holliday junction branch migration protein RuvA [Lactiplantibacillus fabifermentans]ETY73844.1 Holliday junction DNA helicase RuvA [Lactiplantibacillus fabifermentans T30PCM01]KRO28198.1 holliday junction atp-dependent dna helicase ruva [Lactiplantibacillus fabifermentans DSM 21115]